MVKQCQAAVFLGGERYKLEPKQGLARLEARYRPDPTSSQADAKADDVTAAALERRRRDADGAIEMHLYILYF